ncbi:hypothetical protein FISHEDRAFT_58903 [Fistulina hepatica ATCC 64428]|uniref:Uncharacterized protein n=1 Tax=Fistulina hepatica ATCC 64428 TaxID=1128425 RepID=A0A0D7ADC1_9AGAR|nr:hypothetical protein FISHEDRAFT_58903 [Fistulina hepatica ATCC 64428]
MSMTSSISAASTAYRRYRHSRDMSGGTSSSRTLASPVSASHAINGDGKNVVDEQWRAQLERQIQESVSNLIRDARETCSKRITDAPDRRTEFEEEFRRTVAECQSSARETYMMEVRRESQKRIWSTGGRLTPEAQERLRTEQKAILDNIQDQAPRPDGATTTSGEHDAEDVVLIHDRAQPSPSPLRKSALSSTRPPSTIVYNATISAGASPALSNDSSLEEQVTYNYTAAEVENIKTLVNVVMVRKEDLERREEHLNKREEVLCLREADLQRKEQVLVEAYRERELHFRRLEKDLAQREQLVLVRETAVASASNVSLPDGSSSALVGVVQNGTSKKLEECLRQDDERREQQQQLEEARRKHDAIHRVKQDEARQRAVSTTNDFEAQQAEFKRREEEIKSRKRRDSAASSQFSSNAHRSNSSLSSASAASASLHHHPAASQPVNIPPRPSSSVPRVPPVPRALNTYYSRSPSAAPWTSTSVPRTGSTSSSAEQQKIWRPSTTVPGDNRPTPRPPSVGPPRYFDGRRTPGIAR